MLNRLCAYTNDYAEQWKNAADQDIYSPENPSRIKFKVKARCLLEKWIEVTFSELKIYIALQFLMAFIGLPHLKDYLNQ